MKKKIIFSNDVDVEDYKADFEEWCEVNGIDNTEKNLYEFVDACIRLDYDTLNEIMDKPCNDILVTAYLGLWDGYHTKYLLLTGHKINSIFNVIQGDYFELYINESSELMIKDKHHDGTNYYVFREVRNNVNLTNLLDKLINNKLASRQLSACTTRNLTRFFENI